MNEDGSYTYTLHGQHADGSGHQGEQINLLDKVTITGEDGDGDAVDVDLYLKVQDDVPEVSISGKNNVVEGQTIHGTWSHADGADGAVTAVIVNGQTYEIGEDIDTGKGTLTVDEDNTWTFVSNDNLDNDFNQNIQFTVKVTDGDGDVDTDSQTIKISDGDGPSVGGAVSLAVAEAALNPDGTDSSSNAEIDDTVNTLTFTAGSDDISKFMFGSTKGIKIGGLDETQDVTWTASNGGQTLTGSVDGVDAIQLVMNAPTTVEAGDTGDVTVTATLLDNFVHQDNVNVDTLSITGIKVVGSDHDGDSVSGQVSVTVSDDEPVSTSAGNALLYQMPV